MKEYYITTTRLLVQQPAGANTKEKIKATHSLIRCEGNPPVTDWFPHKKLLKWKAFPSHGVTLNSLRPSKNGRHFPDDTFKRIFLYENVRISIKISLKFVPKGPINNYPSLVQIMAWRRPGDKPLSEPMMARLLTHICVTQPQWVNHKIPT